jgi:hypothetical protein
MIINNKLKKKEYIINELKQQLIEKIDKGLFLEAEDILKEIQKKSNL